MKKSLFIICIFFPTLLFGQNYKFSFEKKADLNSDGKTDHIILEKYHSDFDFRLKINGSEVLGNIEDEPDGFIVIDINTSDKYKEIAVHTPGPSDDDVYMIYWFDGKQIKYMNTLSRWPEFIGNGIVYVKGWDGFWSPKDKYKLDNSTRKLVHYKQFAYYVGQEVTCKTGFKIYREKDLKDEVALLSSKSKIEIILCVKDGYEYYDYRFLIKSSSNLLGWTDQRTLEEHAELMFAD